MLKLMVQVALLSTLLRCNQLLRGPDVIGDSGLHRRVTLSDE
jgi:hypothetical protein